MRKAMPLALMAVLAALAIATLVPVNTGSPSDLGYRSFCSFAPWSTLTLLLLAGVIWIVKRYLETRTELPRID